MIKSLTRKLISKHWRNRGTKTIITFGVRDTEYIRIFIRFFNIRFPGNSWSKTWIGAIRFWIKSLPPEDQELFAACEAEFYEKEYNRPQQLITNLMRLYDITETEYLNKRTDSPHL